MLALILGAGYGTRLYPITKNRPKPLLPVGDAPILDHILDRLEPVDEIDHVTIVTNDRFHNHYSGWQEARSHSLPIELVNDGTTTPENRLGAIGDLHYVIEEKNMQEDLLVVAGDNLLEFDMSEFVSFFQDHGTVIGLKDLGDQDVGSYSVVEMDEDNQIVDFEEKPAVPRSSLISIGLYLFQSDHLPRIGEYLDEGHNPDEPGYLIQWLYQQVPVYGYEIDGPWYDIGDITSYNAANDYFENK